MSIVKIDKKHFQVLHSAARAVFKQAVESNEHSATTLEYLTALDAAIEEGHRSLGTSRPAADQYIHLVGGLTKAQAENAMSILRKEGLLPEE